MRAGPIRAAAIAAFVQCAAHFTLFVSARPKHGAAEEAVVAAMRDNRFGPHSYWDMYFGYGLNAAGAVLAEALILWFLVRPFRDASARLAPVLVVLIAANLLHAALVLRYFFPLPALFDGLVATLLLAALLLPAPRRFAAGSDPE
jgi:hypothetical protein